MEGEATTAAPCSIQRFPDGSSWKEPSGIDFRLARDFSYYVGFLRINGLRVECRESDTHWAQRVDHAAPWRWVVVGQGAWSRWYGEQNERSRVYAHGLCCRGLRNRVL
jgi:hypothetical protein